jgi:hypothetical protein
VILLARKTMFPVKGVANDEDKVILDGSYHIGGDLAGPGPGGERARHYFGGGRLGGWRPG